MRQQIRLDTMTDIQKFVNTVSGVKEKVILEDDEGHRVSAVSLLGVIYSMEWARIYCSCDKDISGLILPWTV